MRICFITSRFPFPPIKGDALRVYHQIRALSRDHEITLVSICDGRVAREDYEHVVPLCRRVEIVQLGKLRRACNLAAGALFSRRPLQVAYYGTSAAKRVIQSVLDSEKYDVVHAALIRTLPYVWNRADVPVVTDLIDSYTLNLEARRRQVSGVRRAVYEMEYRRVVRYEQETMKRFGGAVIVTSEADRAALQGTAQSVAVIPNGVDAERFAFGQAKDREPATLIFTGNMGYHPNIEAVQWCVAEVWPMLRERYPSLRFQIVGTNPTPAVKALGDVPGVEVLGRVPDVTTYLHRATLAVCPMRSGSGIQNKMLEAMSAGAPVVATSIANRGVGAADGREVVVADEPAHFVDAVTDLLESASRRADQARHARQLIETAFDWRQHGARLVEVYDGARRRHARGQADAPSEPASVPAMVSAREVVNR